MKDPVYETAAATAGVTLASVPLDQLLLPLQNVVVGIASVLIMHAFTWLKNKWGGR